MPTLFVDCDDTLVVWHDSDIKKKGSFNEFISSDWHFNENIVKVIETWAASDGVVIWSGGGVDYAALWRNRFERHIGRNTEIFASTKEVRLPLLGDIVIDDMPIRTCGDFIDASLFKE